MDVNADLIGAGVADDEEAEEAATVAGAAVVFILTLAPSAFTRLGIFSRLTTGTGTLKDQREGEGGGRKLFRMYFLHCSC